MSIVLVQEQASSPKGEVEDSLHRQCSMLAPVHGQQVRLPCLCLAALRLLHAVPKFALSRRSLHTRRAL